VNDRCGEFLSTTVDSFTAALEIAKKHQATYGLSKLVSVYNQDRMDLEWNGLTDDERDLLAEEL
jgi:hypothetical protein